jgi:hypothetical protein
MVEKPLIPFVGNLAVPQVAGGDPQRRPPEADTPTTLPFLKGGFY